MGTKSGSATGGPLVRVAATVAWFVTAAGTACGATTVGGVLPSRTVWTREGSPYIVVQNVEAPRGGRLVIEPGVEVRFEGYSLVVAGEVVARGSVEAPVLFTSNQEQPRPGDWGFIELTAQSAPARFGSDGAFLGGCVFEHTVVEYGAGFNLVGASPWIVRSMVRFNHAREGGGVFCGGGSPRIEASTIVYNRSDRDGGGVRTASGRPTLVGNRIAFNSARGYGGGVATNHAAVTLQGNTIVHNWAQEGGGVATGCPLVGETSMSGRSHSVPRLEGNLVAHNVAERAGGGLSVRGTPVMVGNRLLFNRLTPAEGPRRDHARARMSSTESRRRVGAGACVTGTYGGPADIRGNLFVGNLGAEWGGGLYSDRAAVRFVDNLVAGNGATGFGGGVSLVNRGPVVTFAGASHGETLEVSGCHFSGNAGGDVEVTGVGGQSVVIARCEFDASDDYAVLNHCPAPVRAEGVWWGEGVSDVEARVWDREDDRSLGRVEQKAAAARQGLTHVTPEDAEAALRRRVAPADLQAGVGVFRVEGAAPALVAGWGPVEADWVAGYRLQVAEVTNVYGQRLPAQTDRGWSPIDAGPATHVQIGGLKPDTTYELTVWAYDSDGGEGLPSSPVQARTGEE